MLVKERINPVLRDGHPQDVAHKKTAEEAESDLEIEPYSVTSLREAVHPKPPLTGTDQ